MKYVIFKVSLPSGKKIVYPIIIPEHVSHSEVKIDHPVQDVEVYSAGFFSFGLSGQPEVDLTRRSVSLESVLKNKFPTTTDQYYLEHALLEHNATAFISPI